MKIDVALLQASWRAWYTNDLRIVGPGWLQWLWTFVFSSIVGLGFFVLGIATYIISSGRLPSPLMGAHWLWANLLISWIIGVCIHTLFLIVVPLVGADRIRRFSKKHSSLFFGSLPALGVAIGWPLGNWVVFQLVKPVRWLQTGNTNSMVGGVLLALLISFIFYKHFEAKARQIEAEKRATEARLRLLQGQIEPHFLFNTLANVQALIDYEPVQAKAMLNALTDYLRASLGGLREDEAPLEDELKLITAYLSIQQTRMGERLRFDVQADADARALTMPPLLLQPLVENAVHHGLEPQVDGGTVVVRAHTRGEQLILEVQDDGRGLQAPSRRGAGMALNNLRERLNAKYAGHASLELQDTLPGTLARLTLPMGSAAS